MTRRAAQYNGITRQASSYLAEHLLARNYRVVGISRRPSSHPGGRIQHLGERVELVGADLLGQISLVAVVDQVQLDRGLLLDRRYRSAR